MKDYYKILEVNKNSTQDEIKKAYRQKSKKYHPDVNPDGTDMFKDIAEAYSILGDENKKKEYDNPNSYGSGGINDIFSMFNSSSFGGGRQRKKTHDKVINLTITPQESLIGFRKNINFQRKECCGGCNGNGGDRVTCGSCGGRGIIQQKHQFAGQTHIQNMSCHQCEGSGSVITNQCFTCNGLGYKNGFNSITVDIPKSVDNGDFLRVSNAGDFSLNGIGDVVVRVNMFKDDGFEKNGENLFSNVKISPENLFIKSDFIVPHPEGNLKLKFPQNFDTSVPLRVRSKGYYNQTGGRGDFIVKFDVNTNLTKITPEITEKLKELLEQVQ